MHESIHLSKELDIAPINDLIKLSHDCVGYGKLIQERNKEVSRSGRLHMRRVVHPLAYNVLFGWRSC